MKVKCNRRWKFESYQKEQRAVQQLSPDLLGGLSPTDTLVVWGNGYSGASLQGTVSVSGAGDRFVMGGPGDSDASGAIWTFVKSDQGTWTQYGSKLSGASKETGVVKYGEGLSVAMSKDGKTVVTGGPNDANSWGATWVYSS
jgi:hypothetical protein